MISNNILIIEDELGVAQPLKRALDLSPNKLYQVEICSSGEDALERLRSTHFDLLISDFRLPGMDGLEMLKQARQMSPSILCVLITAYGSPEMETRVQKLANAYVPKPFHLRDIVNLVQKMLFQAAPVEQAAPPSGPSARFAEQIGTSPIERRRHTHLKVLSSDMDGTIARNGVVPDQTWDLLRQAKIAGMTLILATGRVLANFINDGPFAEIFEAIVAENGAVIFFPMKNQIKQPFGRLSPLLIQRLEGLNIPLERGMSIVATRIPYDETVMKVLQELNVGATIEYNCGAVMLLPPGATKGTGLSYALQELAFSPHNLVVCGDAENDQSQLELAELAVVVPNALPKIKALADVVLPADLDDPGTGINQFFRQLLTRRGPEHRQRPERRLVLGYTSDGAPIYLDPMNMVDSRIGIFGESNSGKSWLSGLLVEELFRLGYQVCVIDPEGDYAALASITHCLHVGVAQSPLPSIADLINLIEWHAISVVVDLSTRIPSERQEYTLEFLRALRGIRTRRGRPHWILIDEAQYFCPSSGGELTDLLLDSLNEGLSVGLVSYCPSQLSSRLIEKLDDCLLTRLRNLDEINALQPYLAKFQDTQDMITQLPTLPVGQAYLCSNAYRPLTENSHSPIRFQAGPRTIPHIRHLQKYLRAPLPEYKRFYFCAPNGTSLGISAASLQEFREMLSAVQLGSLQYHQARGDFERWIRVVLGDSDLAHQVHKLDGRQWEGELLRQDMLELVIHRYAELENLM
jgi:hydroxymethylpyrimidine pyrophosphatase-like HAD family hydrolase/ActR/RegA family two-component response regulator